MKPAERGIAHLLLATRYSYQGLRAAWLGEESFRQEALVILIGVPLALWLARDTIDFLLLTLPLLLLLAAELGNSAVEAVVDRIGEEHHYLSGRAKALAPRLYSWSSFRSLLAGAAFASPYSTSTNLPSCCPSGSPVRVKRASNQSLSEAENFLRNPPEEPYSFPPNLHHCST